MKPGWLVALILAGSLLAAGIILLLSRPLHGAPIILQPPLPTETPSPLVVHITGAVSNPGVYALPPRSRMQDAIMAAGGLKRGADATLINLAAFVEDGQYLAIPYLTVELIYASPPAPMVLQPASRSATIDLDGPVDLNTASQEELETLPGVGPVIAQRIIEYRQTNGPFQTIEDIQKVQGIGPKTFEKMQTLITVSGR